MSWDSEEACSILNTYDAYYYIKPVQKNKKILQKAHRFFFRQGTVRWHIVVARERNEGAVTAYVNARSVSGNPFSKGAIIGAKINKFYPIGHRGSTGEPGIANYVAKLPSLNPISNDVLRLEIDGPSAFKAVVDWYAGLYEFPNSNSDHPIVVEAPLTEDSHCNFDHISGKENSAVCNDELSESENANLVEETPPSMIIASITKGATDFEQGGMPRPMSEAELLDILSRQRENGAAGESIAIAWEKMRLTGCGCSAPADFVTHTSMENIAAGFDIHSNWTDEQERFIEVKTTASGAKHFFMSEHEKQVLTEKAERSYIYIVDLDSSGEDTGNVRTPIKLAETDLDFEPIAYRVRLKDNTA